MAYELPQIVWTPSPNYSSRGGQRVRLIVAHDCEGNAAGAVSWFAQARSRVSAHLVLSEDGKAATQMVAYANKAWHACDFNSVSEGIELGGYASKGFNAPEWDAAAALVAWRLKANGLAPTWAKGGAGEGFTSHYDLGAAGGGHSDPTTDSAMWAAFVARVQAAYGETPAVTKSALPAAAVPPPSGWTPHTEEARHGFAVGALEWVQTELNAMGVASAPLTVDGMMGARTEACIVAYQKSHGLLPDGIAGPKTVEALRNDGARLRSIGPTDAGRPLLTLARG